MSRYKNMSMHQISPASENAIDSNLSYMNPLLVPVILCGGAGSRLWPVSREHHPKPFIRLSDGQSFLQKAFVRASKLPGVAQILTVTNQELFFKAQDDIDEVNESGVKISFILEPVGRNTAAAIAAAAIKIQHRYGNDALMLVLAADHLITEEEAFRDAVEKSLKLAQDGKLVTFGIRPSAPETGYGYIEAAGEKVRRFIEKPSLEKAKEYIADGRFFWNSGMFCFNVRVIIEQMGILCPDIFNTILACMEKSHSTEGDTTSLALDSELFKHVRSDSIDYAVMEKAENIAIVPCDMGWQDIGSWTALGDLAESDENGNRVQGDVVLHNTHNCIIQSDNRLVSAVGVEDLIIVETADALLVANKSNAQDVRHVYDVLKAKEHESYKLHRTVHRPWGTYTVLEEGVNFKMKRIEVKPGASLSLQMHHHRSEHWIVVAGMARVTNGDKEFFVATNESTYIPAGHKHRLANPGMLPLVIIEVQSGEYLGEDDIVRFEDVYNRN